jgi:hypothetical protein
MLTVERVELSALEGAGLIGGYYYDPYPPRFAANLKEVLASGARVLARLHAGVSYPMDDGDLREHVDKEGHVFAVIGYDHDAERFLIADPWDTERFGGDDGGVRSVPETELGLRWVDSTLDQVMIVHPLDVRVEATALSEDVTEITARVALRAPAPHVRSGATTAEDLAASISLPSGLELLSERRQGAAILPAGDAVSLTWTVRETAAADGPVEIAIAAVAHGDDPYPFSDVVGTCATATVRSTALSRDDARVTEAS